MVGHNCLHLKNNMPISYLLNNFLCFCSKFRFITDNHNPPSYLQCWALCLSLCTTTTVSGCPVSSLHGSTVVILSSSFSVQKYSGHSASISPFIGDKFWVWWSEQLPDCWNKDILVCHNHRRNDWFCFLNGSIHNCPPPSSYIILQCCITSDTMHHTV
jgi:hypothetical protein